MAAGLGFKTFQVGEVLLSSDVNGYLMQGVLVFASAAARDAAITSPQEGQCCYLKDTDAVQTYSGSAWVGFDDSNAIQNSIVDAKGDIVAASGNDTPARLAVGSNGDTLVADSATATGLRYKEDYAAGKNKIINGDFGVNQRAFSSTTSNGVFTFDRWLTTVAGTQTYTTQTFTPGTAPVAGYEGSTFLQIATNAGASNYATIQQRIEDVRTFAGQTATVSFWAKANSGTPKVGIQVYQIFGSGGSARVDVTTVYITLSTSWTRYTGNFVIPSISGKTIGTSSYLVLEITVNNAFDATIGQQTNTFQLWGVQLEAGSVATAFQTATGTIQGELAACQRYYSFDSLGNRVWTGNCTSGSTYGNDVYLPVTMRVAPTVTQTHSTSSGFPGTTPGSARISTNKFYSEKTSDGTTTAGFFQMTWTASAEL